MTILDKFTLKGKVALVTGGAGLYGRQIVAALAEAGATTYIASRNLDALEKLASEHRKLGQNVTAIRMDQADEDSIISARDIMLSERGHIDVLVNNAVIRPMKKGYYDDASTFAESMKVNATGLFMITRVIGEAMAAGGRGSIINIGSIQGLVGPDLARYSQEELIANISPDYWFHKGGMISLTRYMAGFYGPKGVRSNCICPGGFQTEDHADTFVKQYNARTFLGRMGNATDLQGAIVFLSSDASEYITGATIPVDGGYTAM